MLPVEDAFKYEADLPNCVGVTLIPQAQHAPALENPDFVAKQARHAVTAVTDVMVVTAVPAVAPALENPDVTVH